MAKHRTRNSSDFKPKVALAGFPEDKSLAEFSSERMVHQSQIIRWKQELITKTYHMAHTTWYSCLC